MRIAVSGAQCTGKSTYIKDFLSKWPMYSTIEERYSDYVKKEGLTLNESGTEKSQEYILNFVVDQIINTKKEDNIILDRCVLDNLAYTTWLGMHGKVSDKFVKKTIDITKQTLVFFDIIFFLPITKHSPITFEPAPNRSADIKYREEIDIIFKSIMAQYNEHSTVYFPFDDKLGSPALIELYGDRAQRIQLTSMYIGDNGQMYGEDQSLLSDEISKSV